MNSNLAKYYRDTIALVCEGFPLPADVRKILETALWNPPVDVEQDPMKIATDALQRIALNVSGDTPAQNIAGDTLKALRDLETWQKVE